VKKENLPPAKGPFGGLTAWIIGLAAVVGALALLMTNFKTLTGALGITSSTILDLFTGSKDNSCLAFIGTPPRTFQMKRVVIDKDYNQGSGVPPGTKDTLPFHIDHVTPAGPGRATFEGYIGPGNRVTGTMDGQQIDFTEISVDGCDTFKSTQTSCSKENITGELLTYYRACQNKFIHTWQITIEP
jgi:hypothetical protein